MHSTARADTETTVLNDIAVEQTHEWTKVIVGFTFPLRYVSHLPASAGREVLVKLAPLSAAHVADCIRFNREIRSVPSTDISVRYAGSNVGGPYLRILFPAKVHCLIRQGNDFRNIEILVQREAPVVSGARTPDLPDEKARQILQEAEAKTAEGKYPRAIQLFTKLAERASSEIAAIAQESLADVRKANGQMAHAKAEYQRYLDVFPDGAAIGRVRRKLTILMSGREEDEHSESEIGGWRKEFYGELSQFFENIGHRFAGDDFEQDYCVLDTDIDLRYRAIGTGFELGAVVNGGYEVAFTDDDENRTRASSLYLDASFMKSGATARIGRSYENRWGVWGRYDGARASFSLPAAVTLNIIGGFPVYSSYDDPETDTRFFGASFDYVLWQNWELNSFYFHQEVDGVTDRQAIGTEIQFSYEAGSIFGLVDYDIYHQDLSMMLLSATYLFRDMTTFTVSGEYRKSPLLTTRNALIGQSVCRLDELFAEYNEDEILQIAKDRSADSKTAYIGIYHIMNKYFQVGFDVTWSKLGDTEPSAGIDGYDGTDDELYYLLQFTGEGLFSTDDIWAAHLKYSDTTNYEVYGLRVYTRLRSTDTLLFVPEIILEHREHKEQDLGKFEAGPELRIEYSLTDNITLELEGGFSWLFRNEAGEEERSEEFFLYLGYYWNF
jgi:tetratricopeptide (TPR) repeat protein